MHIFNFLLQPFFFLYHLYISPLFSVRDFRNKNRSTTSASQHCKQSSGLPYVKFVSLH